MLSKNGRCLDNLFEYKALSIPPHLIFTNLKTDATTAAFAGVSLHKQDSKSVPPARSRPSVHFAVDSARDVESDPGIDYNKPSPGPAPKEQPQGETRKPLHTRIREAFFHLTHHHDALSSSSTGSEGHSGGEFKQPHKVVLTPSPTGTSPSESSQSHTSINPIAIPSPRKHRSFWGLFGRKLEREPIVPESPARANGARSVIHLDESALKLLKENVPEVTEPSDVTFSTKYRFVNSKIIGKGASGVVRLACRKDVKDAQLSNHTLLAVKEFRRRKRDESQHDYLRKITAEFCIATTMHHVNVVETVDMVHDKERWYEVMEYCPGGDLFNAIAHGELDEEQINSCFHELVDGVSYLHSLGVAHRDLKPENILVDQHGHARITDFGVSDVFKVVWERLPHKSRGICGSSPYIAPEEFGGEEYDAQKVDVWSLGIIYYAMIFHSIPWEEATKSDCQFADYLKSGPESFEPFQRLPKHSRDLLKGMLAVDPAGRMSIEEVRQSSWLRRVSFIPLPVIPTIIINNGASSASSASTSSPSVVGATEEPLKASVH